MTQILAAILGLGLVLWSNTLLEYWLARKLQAKRRATVRRVADRRIAEGPRKTEAL